MTERACSSVSVRIALSVTEYGVCNFKKQTTQEGRGEKRLCECVCVFFFFFECIGCLLGGAYHRSPFLDVETTLMTHIGHGFSSSCDVRLFQPSTFLPLQCSLIHLGHPA